MCPSLPKRKDSVTLNTPGSIVLHTLNWHRRASGARTGGALVSEMLPENYDTAHVRSAAV